MIPTNYLTASDTQALLANGKTIIEQILHDHRDRYEERDHEVKAWVCVDHQAAAVATKTNKGPLDGVVIGIKDIINTKHFPTQHGSPIYKGSQPGVDAAVVSLLRNAGASIVGKNYVKEFACGLNALYTHNPFDPEVHPGSSSTGSAAAVADYQCHEAIATQTSASLLRPSSYCGVFGFKPTWGTISLEGVKPIVPMTDSVGIIARSITDIQLVSNVLGVFRHTTTDFRPRPLNQCRFGFFKTDLYDSLATNTIKSIWENARAALLKAGAIVTDLDLGPEFDGWEGADRKISKIMNSGVDISTFSEMTAYPENVSNVVKDRAGAVIPRKELVKIHDELAVLKPTFDAIAGQYDAIITPTILKEAPRVTGPDNSDFAALWSCLQVPVISMPGFHGAGGLPVGLAMVAPRYDDERLLEVAKMVAEVFIKAGKREGNKVVPAPEGIVHVKP